MSPRRPPIYKQKIYIFPAYVINSMGDLRVEVGIPTANNEDTIGETLRTVVSQTRTPDRIIIVDNSTDSTPEIINNIAEGTDVEIDVYPQSDSGNGVGRARQDIYEKFRGDVLICLDTDNKVREDWIKNHVDFHRENSEFDILSNTGGEGSSGPTNNPKDPDYFRQHNCSLTKEVLEDVGGWDPWFPRGEDWDMRLRLWCAGANSYSKSEINSKKIGSEGTGGMRELTKIWVNKKVSAPSSAFFLKKYGKWYLKFHPKHPIADFLSFSSLMFLLVSPVALYYTPLLTTILLSFPLLSSFIYAYYKGPGQRDNFAVQKEDAIGAIVFFVLSISFICSLIDLIRNKYSWNYGGFTLNS